MCIQSFFSKYEGCYFKGKEEKDWSKAGLVKTDEIWSF